ncbi:MAG: hypothetical protein ACFCVF_07430 [Kineosporiaceae bacterium]
MPAHALLGHLVGVVAPMTVVLALGHALWPQARGRLRWPLLGAAAATVALVVATGEVAKDLVAQVEATASAAEVAAAADHAKRSDALTGSSSLLLVHVLVTSWWLLRPGREPSRGSRRAAAVLVALAVALLGATLLTLHDAVTAVWTDGS